MSAIDAYAFAVADVERRARARAADAAFFLFGLQTPSTSASRTPLQGLHVEARVEAAADEADAEPACQLSSCRSFRFGTTRVCITS